MKLSDEDLTIVGDLLAAITTGDRTRLLGDAVVEEIRALRKVAEAAAWITRVVGHGYTGGYVFTDPRDALRAALKEAGYA